MMLADAALRGMLLSPKPAGAGSLSSPKTLTTAGTRGRDVCPPCADRELGLWLTRPAAPERSGCRSRELTGYAITRKRAAYK